MHIKSLFFPNKLSEVFTPNTVAKLTYVKRKNIDDDLENYTFISAEIKKRLTEKKLRYYRSLLQPPQPNNQVAK